MPIAVFCPKCQWPLTVPDDYGGRRVRCSGCAAMVDIPWHDFPQLEPLARDQTAQAVWHVTTADGRRHGPITQAELDWLCQHGQLHSSSPVWQAGWPVPRCAGELYPQLAAAPQAPVAEVPPVAQVPPVAEVPPPAAATTPPPAPQGPLDHALQGPRLDPYRAQGGGGSYAVKVIVLSAVVLAGVALAGLNLALTERTEAFAAALIVLVAGVFALAASLFEWRYFFESRKARGMRALIGDRGARYFYLGFASLLILISFAIFIGRAVQAGG